MRFYSFVSFFFEAFNLCLDFGFISAFCYVVFKHIDAESLTDRLQKMVLIHLRVALNLVTLDTACNFTEFGNCFLFEFLVRVRHGILPLFLGIIVFSLFA